MGQVQETIQNHSGQVLVKTIEDNLIGYAKLHRYLDIAEFYEGPDMVRLVIPGASNPFLNGVWRARLSPSYVDEQIDETLSLFTAKDVPMLWWIGPTTRPVDLGRYLQARGLALVQHSAMAVSLQSLNDDALQETQSSFWIERVNSSESFKNWLHVNIETFEFPESVANVISQVFVGLGFGEDSPVRHYVGYANGDPVASASLFGGAGVAGIYNVATVPDRRRQGFGTAITLRPLLDARSIGFQTGVLTASKIGFNVYSKLGFKECRKTYSYLLGDS